MKIVHLSTRIKISYGGGEKFLKDFLQHLPGHEHIFIGQDKVVENIFSDLGKEVHSSPAGFEPLTLKRQLFIPLSFILGFIQFIKFFRYWKSADIILISASSIAEPIFLIPWIKLFFPKKRIVQFMHALCVDYYWKNPLTWLLRRTWSSMEVVFVSNTQLNDWKSRNLLGKTNHVIYNGTKTFAQKEIAKPTNLAEVNILYAGRMYWQKGVDTIVQAAELLETKKKINFIFAGDGEELENLKAAAKKINKENINFKFLGFVKEIDLAYKNVNLCLFPSHLESFGLVVIESWARGIPVLTSNIEAFKELKQAAVLEEQKLTFQVKNPVDLAKKIEYYLQNQTLYDSLDYRTALAKMTDSKFSITTTFKNYQELLCPK